MGFWKALLGGKDQTPEEEQQEREQRNFDLLKYDGVKAMKIGQPDYAVKCYREALKIKEDPEVRDYLSQALIQKGELAEAAEQLKLLAEAEPNNEAIVLRTAQVAYMMEDYAQMATACERAMQINPSSAIAHYLKAQACLGQQNVVEAIAMLTKTISLQEENADAYLLRAQTLLAMGDVKGAADDAAWLLENAGDHEEVLLLNARVAARRQQTDEALAFYDQVTEVNPFSIEAYQERGQLRFNLGDKAGAEQDMQKVLELNPNALADVNGEYSAEGIEQRVRQAYSVANPLGL
jgi:tetratricopeptide (TPR) repeat protein